MEHSGTNIQEHSFIQQHATVYYKLISSVQESSFSYDPNAPPSEVNHDTLFREGLNARGDVTYTPRMLLVDLKGSLKQMPRSGGDLYGTTDVAGIIRSGDSVLWDADGQLDVHLDHKRLKIETTSTEAPELQQIDDADDDEQIDDQNVAADSALSAGENATPSDTAGATGKALSFSQTVEAWTDYTHTRYHPRSINIIDSLDHSATVAALDTFSAGAALWRGEQFEDGDFGDRIRQYIEECNSCQAFQVLFDAADGFTGLAAAGMQHLRDEYGKTVMGVPLFAGDFRSYRHADKAMNDSIRVVNVAMAYSQMLAGDGDSGSAAMLLPMSASRQVWRQRSGQRELPMFGYSVSNAYESAAVLAACLDTVSLEYRHPSGANTLGTFCASLNNYGRRLGTVGLALPFRFGVEEQLINVLDKIELGDIFTTLSPNSRLCTDKVVQHVAVRGIPELRLKQPLAQAGDQIRMAAYGCDSSAEMLQLFFQCSMYGSLTHVRSVQCGMAVRSPFPVELFDERVQTPHGWWQEWTTTAVNGQPQQFASEMPVMACVQTSCELARTIESLHREASRVRIAKIPRFAATGMEPDELTESLEQLRLFMDNYDDAFEL